jgi:hypothetical protein
VINASIYGMTCEALVHALGRETPCMTMKLQDVTTDEEAIQAKFSGKVKVTVTSVVETAATTPPRPNVAVTRGTRTESAVGRRWWPRPTALPGSASQAQRMP